MTSLRPSFLFIQQQSHAFLQFQSHSLIIMEEKVSGTLSRDLHHNEAFYVQLTPQQAKAVALVLPLGYSLQVENRRKDKSQSKKKTADQLLLSMAEPLPRSKQVAVVPPPPQKKSGQKQDLIPQAVKPCLKTLQLLQQHKYGLPFLEPVDVDALSIPQYLQIVREPMDLSTIQTKLKGGKYQTPAQFHQDVIKIFYNSYLFNHLNDDFMKITAELQRYYYRISGETKPPVEKQMTKAPVPPSKSQKKKKKPPTGSREVNDSQPITTEQKRELAFQIHRLAKEHIKGVRSIVFDGNSDQNQFDLQQVSQKKLRELQKYVRGKITEMENNMRSNMLQKSEQPNLDELQSEITEQFIDEPLEGHKMNDQL